MLSAFDLPIQDVFDNNDLDWLDKRSWNKMEGRVKHCHFCNLQPGSRKQIMLDEAGIRQE